MKKWIFTFLMSSFLSTPAWANLNCGGDELAFENNLAVELLNTHNISITTVVGFKTKQLSLDPVHYSTRSFSTCTDRAWNVEGEVEVTFKDAGRLCRQSFFIKARTKDKKYFQSEPSSPIICR